MIKTTRLKLRIDTIDKWESPESKPLLEGEIGIGYKNTWNSKKETYEKTNFIIKIGRKLLKPDGTPSQHWARWEDAADLHCKIDSEQYEQIINEIKNEISGLFVEKDDFDAAIEQINNRLNNKVSVSVNEETLEFSKDSDSNLMSTSSGFKGILSKWFR